MNNALIRTASAVIDRATGLSTTLKHGATRWFPEALRMVSAGAQLAVLRDGGRKAVKVVRRYPVAAAVTVAVAAGAGVALWLLRRRKHRRGPDKGMRAIEVKPARVSRRNGAANRIAAKRSPRKQAASKAAPTN